jgi:hypothetical protein
MTNFSSDKSTPMSMFYSHTPPTFVSLNNGSGANNGKSNAHRLSEHLNTKATITLNK